MKKVVLRIDENEQYGFVLIGIVCQHRDYRLCREINLALDISLARDNDFEVFTKKRMEAMTFTRFSFTNEEEDNTPTLEQQVREADRLLPPHSPR